MKLLTLNLHSLVEIRGMDLSWEHRFHDLAERILQEQYDLIALQEVNQPENGRRLTAEELKDTGYVGISEEETIREGNAASELVKVLHAKGVSYQWSYCFSHLGYETFEEGTAMLSRLPVQRAFSLDVSRKEEKGRWTYRRQTCLEILQDRKKIFACSVHFGWWNGRAGSEGFPAQWGRMLEQLGSLPDVTAFLMGDFNNADTVRGEGYDLVTGKDVFFDSYMLAEQKEGKDSIATILTSTIDGWEKNQGDAKRLDYIMISRPLKVSSYHTVFDGKNAPVVSDHFGVEVELSWHTGSPDKHRS